MKKGLLIGGMFLLLLASGCGSVGSGISGNAGSSGGSGTTETGGSTQAGKQSSSVTFVIPIKLSE